jgi:hypothetical protein
MLRGMMETMMINITRCRCILEQLVLVGKSHPHGHNSDSRRSQCGQPRPIFDLNFPANPGCQFSHPPCGKPNEFSVECVRSKVLVKLGSSVAPFALVEQAGAGCIKAVAGLPPTGMSDKVMARPGYGNGRELL